MEWDGEEVDEREYKPGTSPYVIAMLIGTSLMFLTGIVFTFLEIMRYRS